MPLPPAPPSSRTICGGRFLPAALKMMGMALAPSAAARIKAIAGRESPAVGEVGWARPVADLRRALRWLTLLAGIAATACGAADATAPMSPEVADQLDALFQTWNRPTSPGAAVAVIHHGRMVYEKGFGCANLEYDIPIEARTVFHVASVSKQFTAMAVILLEQDGKLSIDDEVRKYLPELPDYGHVITLRHLLQHTSGIRDQWSTLALAGWDLKDVITQDQILRLLFRQKELNFTPGAKMLYSNGGFTLLAEVVRRVGGQPFPQFCQERIFAPLGMSRTHFHLELDLIVPQRAYSYEPKPGGFGIAPLNFANVGATSLFATAGDLALWLDNFRAPKVGGAQALARIQEQGILSSGQKIDYALGIGPGKYRGLRTLSHGGADAGYRSHVLWFPAQEFGVAVVSNHARFNAGALANSVSDLLLATEFTEAKGAAPVVAPRVAVDLEPATFDRYVGSYAFDEGSGFAINYTREGDKFYGQATGQSRFEIFPESATKFFYKVVDAQVAFEPDGDGRVNRLIHHQGGRSQPAKRVEPALPPAVGELESYAGHYWSEELETRYSFFLKEGRMFGLHIRHGEFALTRTSGAKFRTSLWFMPSIDFVRDASGNVAGAKLGGGRVVGVNFLRQPTLAAAPAPAP